MSSFLKVCALWCLFRRFCLIRGYIFTLTNIFSPLEGVSSLLTYPKPRLSQWVLHLSRISLSTQVLGWKTLFTNEEGVLLFISWLSLILFNEIMMFKLKKSIFFFKKITLFYIKHVNLGFMSLKNIMII